MWRKVLVAIDLSHPESELRVLDHAANVAANNGAELDVLTVTPDYSMSIVGSFFHEGTHKKALEQVNEALHDFVRQNLKREVPVKHIVAVGNVYEEILDTSIKLKSDLIVIGAHRPDLRDFLLGPNAARVARHAQASVLIVRPDYDEMPMKEGKKLKIASRVKDKIKIKRRDH